MCNKFFVVGLYSQRDVSGVSVSWHDPDQQILGLIIIYGMTFTEDTNCQILKIAVDRQW